MKMAYERIECRLSECSQLLQVSSLKVINNVLNSSSSQRLLRKIAPLVTNKTMTPPQFELEYFYWLRYTSILPGFHLYHAAAISPLYCPTNQPEIICCYRKNFLSYSNQCYGMVSNPGNREVVTGKFRTKYIPKIAQSPTQIHKKTLEFRNNPNFDDQRLLFCL